MKYLISFIFMGVCVANIFASPLPDDVKDIILSTKKECMDENPDLDHSHVEKLMKHEFVEDDHLKKFVLCFHQKTHMQEDDGSFNTDNIKEFLAKMIGDHTHDNDVDECTKHDHHDATENAWEFVKCIKAKLPKVDIE